MNPADKMAKFNPPERFSFENPTKLKDDGSVLVSSLVYAMESEAEKILASFSFENEEDKEKFDVVLSKFEEYFIPKWKLIHERTCFYQRNQLPGEKVETYIRSLYELAANSEFSDKRDEHIRDRLVVGIKDKRLSQKLQLMPTLMLSSNTTCKAVRRYCSASWFAYTLNAQRAHPTSNTRNAHYREGEIHTQTTGRSSTEQHSLSIIMFWCFDLI